MKKYLERMPPSGRLEYAAACAVFCSVPLSDVRSLIADALTYFQAAPPRLGSLLTLLMSAGGLCLMLALTGLLLVLFSYRRLLDLGEPPRRAWLVLIPVYNLYFMVRLMAKTGATPPPIHGGKPAIRTRGIRVGSWVALGLAAVLWALRLADLTAIIRGLPL